jgi:Domain of unknown function (DUF4190)
MTEPPDTPPDRRENPEGTPQTAPPYPYPTPYQYQPGPHPGYLPAPPPPPYYGYPRPPVQPRNGLGIASLVLAIIALVSVWSVFVAVVLGIIAVIIGFLGRGRVKRGTANNGGVAIAGIVLGTLAVIVGLAFVAVWTAVWKDVGGGDYIDCMQKAGSDHFQQQRCADQFRQNVQDRLSVTLTPTPVP